MEHGELVEHLQLEAGVAVQADAEAAPAARNAQAWRGC
jgi:hypothetical protein